MRFVNTEGFQTYIIINAYLKENSFKLALPKMLDGNFFHNLSPATKYVL